MKKKKLVPVLQVKQAIISDKVGNYENHPVVVEKTRAAKEIIAKYGLPKEVEESLAKRTK